MHCNACMSHSFHDRPDPSCHICTVATVTVTLTVVDRDTIARLLRVSIRAEEGLRRNSPEHAPASHARQREYFAALEAINS